MPEAVIVDAVRTPIGRAFKGSLAQLRPDEMGAFIVDALLERNQDVDPELIEEVYCGCGMPQGLQGFNIGRIIALLSEQPPARASTARPSRATAPPASSRSARPPTPSWPARATPTSPPAWSGSRATTSAVEGARRRTRTRGSRARTATPTPTSRWATPPRTWPSATRSARADMDKYAQRSQELAVQSQESGYFDREIVPVTLPDGTVVAKDDGPRASSTLEKLSELEPAFKEDGKVTAGNSCPLNDGAAAVLVMSDTKANELGLKPRARIIAVGHRRERARVHGRRADLGDQEGPRASRHDDRRRRHGRAERGVRRPGDPDHGRVQHPAREDEPARRRDRPRAPVRHDRARAS